MRHILRRLLDVGRGQRHHVDVVARKLGLNEVYQMKSQPSRKPRLRGVFTDGARFSPL